MPILWFYLILTEFFDGNKYGFDSNVPIPITLLHLHQYI